MTAYETCTAELASHPRRWLVTGAAGFIGSHLVENLLRLGQHVTGLDSFILGKRENLDEVRAAVDTAAWKRFRLIEGDVRDPAACRDACGGVDLVLHEAALGAVPRSLEDPLAAHESNSTGFLNMLLAARAARVQRFVYASSSSVYGDLPPADRVESTIGAPLSPYAVTKLTNELYAGVFARQLGLPSIGLRYFNVYGPRQDAQGAYAAVIPLWTSAMLAGKPVYINGDGQTSRDFCYVDNVVQCNLLAATTTNAGTLDQVYNVALGQSTTLDELFAAIQQTLAVRAPQAAQCRPIYRDFRAGDVRHSRAEIGKARELLGFEPSDHVAQGLAKAMHWYVAQAGKAGI